MEQASEIGRLWAGQIYGTNTGNVFAEFTSEKGEVSGTIRLLDDRHGPVVYQVTGTFDGTAIELSGSATQQEEEVETGTISVEGTLTAEGQIRGKWSSSLGTGGIFQLFPHDQPETRKPTAGDLPEQLYTASRTVGALRIYPEDLRVLTDSLRKDFPQGRIVATYHEPGNPYPVSKYWSDFEQAYSRLDKLLYLKLVVQQHEAHGINRYAMIELSATGKNQVLVQGIQEPWVRGKSEEIVSLLGLSEKSFSTTVRRYGLNLNGALLIGALVFLPELSLERRAVFLLFVVIAIGTIAKMHERYIPNVMIILSKVKPNTFIRAWPQILSWLITVSATLTAAIVYGLLNDYFPVVTNWIATLFGKN